MFNLNLDILLKHAIKFNSIKLIQKILIQIFNIQFNIPNLELYFIKTL
jgi:hypothetical protein